MIASGIAISALFVLGAFVGNLWQLLIPDRYWGGESVQTGGHLRRLPIALLPFVGGISDTSDPADWLKWSLLPMAASILAVAEYFRFESLYIVALAAVYSSILLALFLTDYRSRLLPDRLILVGVALAVCFAWLLPDHSAVGTIEGLFVGFGLASLFLLGSLPFGSQAFGSGDVKFIVFLGILLGPGSVLVAIVLAALAASVISVAMLMSHLRKRRDFIPFGCFLATAGLVSLLWGTAIWHWYVGN